MEKIGDAAVYNVRSINANDIESGILKMPHTQKAAWRKVQSEDRAHRMFLELVQHSKVPLKKKTKGEFTTVKRLHNFFRTGQAKIDPNGLVTVKHTDAAGNIYDAISVPPAFFPGLVHALHIRLNHPSKTQLHRLMSRHFYCSGQARIIDEVTSSCTLCASLRNLPKELFSETTVRTPTFGANFSADVIKKDGQLVFLCREKLSQLTSTRLIPDETADSLRDSIVTAVLELIPDTGTTIQVDCAPGLQSLAAESKLDGSVLKKLGIAIDLGRTHNVNKNPIAENAIKEFHKERLKLNPAGGKISEIERSIITKNMNSRIRERGLTSKEMAFNRDQTSNKVKPADDEALANRQVENRENRHPIPKEIDSDSFHVGENVFLKSDKSKLRAREMYKITKIFQENNENWAMVQKCDSKFMSKEYKVKFSEIFKIPFTKIAIDTANDVHEDDIIDADKTGKAMENKSNQEEDEANLLDEDIEDCKDSKLSNKEAENVQKRKTNVTKRPKRQAAIKFQDKMKRILPCLNIKTKTKPCFHGWNYEDWFRELEDDQYYEYIPENNNDLNTTVLTFTTSYNESEDNQTQESPFVKFLKSLERPSFHYNQEQMNENYPVTGFLDMFPPVDEEMTWDDATTPPPLRQGTAEDVEEELVAALTPTKLFDTDDDSARARSQA